MSDVSFQVSMQGISRDMRSANGHFDPVDFGSIPEDKLRALLSHVSQFSEPKYAAGEESCPPVVTSQGAGGLFTFTMEKGSIWCENTQSEISPQEACDLASGRSALTSSPRSGTPHRNANYQPAWMTDISPTDEFNTDEATINTGQNSPQISEEVWSSIQAYKNGGMFFGIGAFGAAFTFAVLLGDPSFGLASIAAIITAICVLTPFLTRTKRRILFRLGFDPASNTLWSQRGFEPPQWHANGNETVGFHIKDCGRNSDPAFSYEPALERWSVDMIRSNGASLSVGAFVKKTEAHAVSLKAENLFRSLSQTP
tara:strand:- start:708 stop:1643 length:936 start_codon:yes stop_codon:yes gene_type:complete